MLPRAPRSTLFPYKTLFRSQGGHRLGRGRGHLALQGRGEAHVVRRPVVVLSHVEEEVVARDRKSTRLNSSHEWISYAVFCLKKKTRRHRFNCRMRPDKPRPQ